MTEEKDFCEPYKILIEALLDKHAKEVTVHDLSELSGFAETFIVAVSRSELHSRTLKDTAEEALDRLGLPYRIEGENSSKWTLIDVGHLIVNILSREGRDFYRLDSLWGDAPTKRFVDQDD
ncbi:MAG: ribosome silencing factor [Synergistaceae bacterium]|nr:ribosome silencing factor [Synergistaceae bacterium]